MSTAELSACRTATQAALTDYQRSSEAGELDMMARAVWAERLASLLGSLLDELDHTDSNGGQSQ